VEIVAEEESGWIQYAEDALDTGWQAHTDE
jgi:hypothetical protein